MCQNICVEVRGHLEVREHLQEPVLAYLEPVTHQGLLRQGLV